MYSFPLIQNLEAGKFSLSLSTILVKSANNHQNKDMQIISMRKNCSRALKPTC